MKPSIARLLCAITIPLALAIPARLASAAPTPPRYIAIDMGTLGGPNAYFELPGQVMNARGAVIFDPDTSTADPYAPNCFNPDCFVSLGVEYQRGVKTTLGSLPGVNSAAPFAITNNGLIAGLSQNGVLDPATGLPETRAVLWKDGRIQNLGTLSGGDESNAFAVNDRGLVAGPSSNGTPDPYGCQIFICWATQTRGFVWEHGLMKDMGTLGGPDTLPWYINNQGQIAGMSYTSYTPNPDNGPACAAFGAVSGPAPTLDIFLWQHGKMKNLGNLGGTCTFMGGEVEGLNSRGEVVGQSSLPGNQTFHPVLWNGTKLVDLGTLGGNLGSALAVNEAGHVVGWATTPGDTAAHGFLWQTGRMTDLGTAPGHGCALANAINVRDQVVGGSCNALGDGWLSDDGTIYNLNNLVAPSSIRLAEAHAIDDRGEIVCRGVLANGDVHLLMLVPSALAAGEGLTSNVPAGSPPAPRSSVTRADLHYLLHASRFWNYDRRIG